MSPPADDLPPAEGPAPDPGPVPLPPLQPGRYVDFESVGEGGMGVVYLALDSHLGRRVALKVVRGTLDALPGTPAEVERPTDDSPVSAMFAELESRFLREATITGAMEHPGIVPVYELGRTEAGVPYYTMRFVRGARTLGDALRDASDLPARLALLEPFLRVCDTIRYAHGQGVLHRDIKPDNIALGQYGEVIVLDWGLAKLLGQEDDAGQEEWQARLASGSGHQTVAGLIGTPGYLAPEIAASGGEGVDERADVYSLGVVLFEILGGRLPVPVTSLVDYLRTLQQDTPPRLRDVAPTVPAGLAAIVDDALHPDPSQRIASAGSLASRLRVWQQDVAQGQARTRHLDRVEDALDHARRAQGTDVLAALEPATAALDRARETGSDERLAALAEAVAQERRRGVAEGQRQARRRAVRGLAAAALVLLLVGAGIALWVIEGARQDAEAARQMADDQRKEAVAAEARATRTLAASWVEVARRHMAVGEHGAAMLAANASLAIAPTTDAWLALGDAALRAPPGSYALPSGIQAGALAASPDGRRIAVAGAWGQVLVFDATTRTSTMRLVGAQRKVTDLVWIDLHVLAGVAEDGTVRTWDARTREETGVWAGPNAALRCLATSADGSVLLAGSDAGHLVRVDRAAEQAHVQLVTPDQGIRQLQSGERSAPVIVTLASGEARQLTWQADGWSTATSHPAPGPAQPTAPEVDLPPVVRWQPGEGPGRVTEHAAQVADHVQDETGARWVSTAHGDLVVLGPTGVAPVARIAGHGASVKGTWWLGPDTLLTWGQDGVLAWWRLSERRLLRRIHLGDGPYGLGGFVVDTERGEAFGIVSLAALPDDPVRWALVALDPATGQVRWWRKTAFPTTQRQALVLRDAHVLLGQVSGGVMAYRRDSGEPVATASLPDAGSVLALSASPDGTHLAMATTEPGRTTWIVRLRDLEAGTTVTLPGRSASPPMGLAFTADGHHLAAALQAGVLRIWDTRDLTAPSRDLDLEEAHAYALRFDSRRQAFLVGGQSTHVVAWPALNRITRWSGQAGAVSDIALGPDGRTAVAGWDGSVRIHGRGAVGGIRTVRAPTPITAVQRLPGREALVVGQTDQRVRLLSWQDGRVLRTLEPVTDAVHYPAHLHRPTGPMACSADGQRLAVLDFDRVLRVHDLADGRILASFPSGAQTPTAMDLGRDGRSLAWVEATFSAPLPGLVAHPAADASCDLVQVALGGDDTPERRAAHRGGGRFVQRLAAGRWLTGGDDGRVQVWGGTAGDPAPWPGRARAVVAGLLTGEDVAVAALDGEITFHDPATGRVRTRVRGEAPLAGHPSVSLLLHKHQASAFQFSPRTWIQVRRDEHAPHGAYTLPVPPSGLGDLALIEDMHLAVASGAYTPQQGSRDLHIYMLAFWRFTPAEREAWLEERLGLQVEGAGVVPTWHARLQPVGGR